MGLNVTLACYCGIRWELGDGESNGAGILPNFLIFSFAVLMSIFLLFSLSIE